MDDYGREPAWVSIKWAQGSQSHAIEWVIVLTASEANAIIPETGDAVALHPYAARLRDGQSTLLLETALAFGSTSALHQSKALSPRDQALLCQLGLFSGGVWQQKQEDGGVPELCLFLGIMPGMSSSGVSLDSLAVASFSSCQDSLSVLERLVVLRGNRSALEHSHVGNLLELGPHVVLKTRSREAHEDSGEEIGAMQLAWKLGDSDDEWTTEEAVGLQCSFDFLYRVCHDDPQNQGIRCPTKLDGKVKEGLARQVEDSIVTGSKNQPLFIHTTTNPTLEMYSQGAKKRNGGYAVTISATKMLEMCGPGGWCDGHHFFDVSTAEKCVRHGITSQCALSFAPKSSQVVLLVDVPPEAIIKVVKIEPEVRRFSSTR